MRLSYALIDISNLKYNFLNIRKKIKDVRIMAIVKADAYGHGVMEVVKALNSLPEKPEYYGVAILEEAIELRRNNVSQPILIFNPVIENDSDLFSKYDLISSVFNEKHLSILKKANHIRGRKIKVHVKVDTGMHRLGIDYREAFDFIKKLSRDKNFILDGIYTHFANSDEKNKSYRPGHRQIPPGPWNRCAKNSGLRGHSVRQSGNHLHQSGTPTHGLRSSKPVARRILCGRCVDRLDAGDLRNRHEPPACIRRRRNTRGGSGVCLHRRFCQSPCVQSARDWVVGPFA